MLFSNDSGNAEFTHFNKLAEKFGINLITTARTMF